MIKQSRINKSVNIVSFDFSMMPKQTGLLNFYVSASKYLQFRLSAPIACSSVTDFFKSFNNWFSFDVRSVIILTSHCLINFDIVYVFSLCFSFDNVFSLIATYGTPYPCST